MNTYVYTVNHNLADDHFLVGYQEGDLLVRGHTATVEAPSMEDACEAVYALHNQDDRPDGKLAPSLSVGDVIVLGETEGNETDAFAVVDVGVEWVPMPENVESTKSYLEASDETRPLKNS